MAQTSRRPSPLRESTHPALPSTASPVASTSSARTPDEMLNEYHLQKQPSPSTPQSASSASSGPSASSTSNRSARPKSFIDRILRNSTSGSSSSLSSSSSPSSSNTAEAPGPTRVDRADGGGEKAPSRWDKRASRKAPPPPRSTPGSSPTSTSATGAMPENTGRELSRQTSKAPQQQQQQQQQQGQALVEKMISRGLESEMRDFWDRGDNGDGEGWGDGDGHGHGDSDGRDGRDEGEMEIDGFLGVESLPKVFLFPPEEDAIQPIKLYPQPPPPPPPPQTLPRPPLIHLAQTSSRPSSIFSVDSNAGRNTWGGMEKQFGKPPPRFRRGGADVLAANGVVMPKKREQVVREEQQRRRSAIPEGVVDWEAPGSPPLSRPYLPHATQRSYSAPPALVMSPPRIFITSDSAGSLTTETAHSDTAHSAESAGSVGSTGSFASDEPGQLALSEFDLAFESESDLVDSPIEVGPVDLPIMPGVDDIDVGVDNDGMEESSPDVCEVTTKGTSGGLDLDLGPISPPPVLADKPDTPVPGTTSAAVDGVSEPERRPVSSDTPTTTSRKGRNRRSMSLTAILAPKAFQEAPPPVPAVPDPSTNAGASFKVIRKHKSLKKFFFSSGDLAKEERGPVPAISKEMLREKELVKEKDAQRRREKADKEASAGKDSKHQAEISDDAPPVPPKRSGFGMLSRPKSKPSLRIDVKASNRPPVPARPSEPSSAPSSSAQSVPAPSKTPRTASTTGTSSSSEAYPETPSSRSSSKSKTKPAASTPAAPESAGGTRGLTKRFSLSNMSAAFKRAKKDVPVVPQVPDLPAVYKRDAAGRSLSSDAAMVGKSGTSRDVKESAVPLSPKSPKMKLQEAAVIDSPKAYRPLLSPTNSPGQGSIALPESSDSQPPSPRAMSIRSAISAISAFTTTSKESAASAHALPAPRPASPDAVSILSGVSATSALSTTSSAYDLETELSHAKLMLVSPRTRRNPAESLQDILGVAPSRQTRQSTVVVRLDEDGHGGYSRRSVEAVILGGFLIGSGSMGTLEEEGGDNETREGESINRLEGDGSSTGEAMAHGVGDESATSPRQYDSEVSLESLSRSSSTSDPLDHLVAPVTPSAVGCGPSLELPPPLPPLDLISAHTIDTSMNAETDGEPVIVDTPSMDEVYASPASTVSATNAHPKRSPEGLFRFLGGHGHGHTTSPKTAKDKDADPASAKHHKSDRAERAGKAVKAVAVKHAKVVQSVAKAVHMSFPIPPPPPIPESRGMAVGATVVSGKGGEKVKEYSSLEGEVQLRSLHFESGLGLDFEFGFGRDERDERERGEEILV